MGKHENLGKEFNLEIMWANNYAAYLDSTCRALVWLLRPTQLAATICIDDAGTYAIYTQGLYGLTDRQREGLERYLESRGWRKREQYSGE